MGDALDNTSHGAIAITDRCMNLDLCERHNSGKKTVARVWVCPLITLHIQQPHACEL